MALPTLDQVVGLKSFNELQTEEERLEVLNWWAEQKSLETGEDATAEVGQYLESLEPPGTIGGFVNAAIRGGANAAAFAADGIAGLATREFQEERQIQEDLRATGELTGNEAFSNLADAQQESLIQADRNLEAAASLSSSAKDFANRTAERFPQSLSTMEAEQEFNNVEGFFKKAGVALKNPIDLAAPWAIEAAVASSPAILASVGGAVAGSAAGPGGTLAGASAGAGFGGAAFEYSAALREAVQNEVGEDVDLNNKHVLMNALRKPEVWEEAHTNSVRRGATVGFVNAATMAVGGTFLGRGVAQTIARAGVEIVSEGAGEALGGAVSGIGGTAGDIIQESIGGAPGSLIEVGTTVALAPERARQDAIDRIQNAELSDAAKQSVLDAVNDDDIARADLWFQKAQELFPDSVTEKRDVVNLTPDQIIGVEDALETDEFQASLAEFEAQQADFDSISQDVVSEMFGPEVAIADLDADQLQRFNSKLELDIEAGAIPPRPQRPSPPINRATIAQFRRVKNELFPNTEPKDLDDSELADIWDRIDPREEPTTRNLGGRITDGEGNVIEPEPVTQDEVNRYVRDNPNLFTDIPEQDPEQVIRMMALNITDGGKTLGSNKAERSRNATVLGNVLGLAIRGLGSKTDRSVDGILNSLEAGSVDMVPPENLRVTRMGKTNEVGILTQNGWHVSRDPGIRTFEGQEGQGGRQTHGFGIYVTTQPGTRQEKELRLGGTPGSFTAFVAGEKGARRPVSGFFNKMAEPLRANREFTKATNRAMEDSVTFMRDVTKMRELNPSLTVEQAIDNFRGRLDNRSRFAIGRSAQDDYYNTSIEVLEALGGDWNKLSGAGAQNVTTYSVDVDDAALSTFIDYDGPVGVETLRKALPTNDELENAPGVLRTALNTLLSEDIAGIATGADLYWSVAEAFAIADRGSLDGANLGANSQYARQASQYLLDKGIKGIVYGRESAAAQQDTGLRAELVAFDGADIRIMSEDGKERFYLDESNRIYQGTSDGNANKIKGYIEFTHSGKAFINGIRGKADASTVIHEFGHFIRRMLPEGDMSKLEEAYGVKDSSWTRRAEEQFAKDFEAYLARGKFPKRAERKVKGLKRIFDDMVNTLVSLYETIRGGDSIINRVIDDSVVEVLDDLILKGAESRGAEARATTKAATERAVAELGARADGLKFPINQRGRRVANRLDRERRARRALKRFIAEENREIRAGNRRANAGRGLPAGFEDDLDSVSIPEPLVAEAGAEAAAAPEQQAEGSVTENVPEAAEPAQPAPAAPAAEGGVPTPEGAATPPAPSPAPQAPAARDRRGRPAGISAGVPVRDDNGRVLLFDNREQAEGYAGSTLLLEGHGTWAIEEVNRFGALKYRILVSPIRQGNRFFQGGDDVVGDLNVRRSLDPDEVDLLIDKVRELKGGRAADVRGQTYAFIEDQSEGLEFVRTINDLRRGIEGTSTVWGGVTIYRSAGGTVVIDLTGETGQPAFVPSESTGAAPDSRANRDFDPEQTLQDTEDTYISEDDLEDGNFRPEDTESTGIFESGRVLGTPQGDPVTDLPNGMVARSRLIRRIEASPFFSDTTKRLLDGLGGYTPISNMTSLDHAESTVDTILRENPNNGIEALAAYILGNEATEGSGGALAMVEALFFKAVSEQLKTARGHRATDLAEFQTRMAEYIQSRARGYGRYIQALRLFTRMTPEGIVRTIQEQVKRASIPNETRFNALMSSIKVQVYEQADADVVREVASELIRLQQEITAAIAATGRTGVTSVGLVGPGGQGFVQVKALAKIINDLYQSGLRMGQPVQLKTIPC